MSHEPIFFKLESRMPVPAKLVTHEDKLCILYYTDVERVPGTPIRQGTPYYVPLQEALSENRVLTFTKYCEEAEQAIDEAIDIIKAHEQA